MTLVATDAIAEWFHLLYDDAEGWLSLFAFQRSNGQRYVRWADTPEALALEVEALADSCDVWHGVATRKENLGFGNRGGSDDCLQVPGLWVDLDIAGPNHVAQNLPPTLEDAYLLLEDFPAAPTAIIHTGGGLQAWWLFAEPIDATTIRPFLVRWGTTWAELGRRHGWHVDNVFDISRVLRVPGTLNHKGTPPQNVTVALLDAETRWGLDDLEKWTVDPPAPSTPRYDRQPHIGDDRPGDVVNNTWDPGDMVTKAGCVHDHTDRNGDRHYRAPHHADELGTTGVTIYADDRHTTIYSETWAQRIGAEVRRPYDPFGLLTIIEYRGDFNAAREDLEAQGIGTTHTDPAALIGDSLKDSDTAAASSIVPGDTLLDRLRASLLTMAQLRALPPPRWRIDGIFYDGSVVLLWSPPGGFKSFVAADMALSIAYGVRWHDRKVWHGPVIYYAGEGKAMFQQRIDAWLQGHGRQDTDAFVLGPLMPNLMDATWRAAAHDLAIERQPALVVFDTVARAMVGGEENSAKDMGILVDLAGRIAQTTGAIVLLVHHSTKTGEHYRGSSALQGAVDTEIEVQRDGMNVRLYCRKQKDAYEFDPIDLHLETRGDSLIVVEGNLRQSDMAVDAAGEQILEALTATTTASAIGWTRIKDATDIPPRTLTRRLNDLVKEGVVTKTANGRYFLT